jgi:uncharacterized protein
MGFGRTVSTCLLCAALAGPAAAQFSDSYNFIQAVKDGDGTKAMQFLNKPGEPVLNTKEPGTGETALHIVVRQHQENWVAFLLSRGALPDAKDHDGNTPLHVAASVDDTDAITLLLERGARVNVTNNNGETPLILAVHRRDPAAVRILVANGADPKLADTIAGKSARDYAAEDSRSAALVKLMDDAKPAPAKHISGPVLPH